MVYKGLKKTELVDRFPWLPLPMKIVVLDKRW